MYTVLLTEYFSGDGCQECERSNYLLALPSTHGPSNGQSVRGPRFPSAEDTRRVKGVRYNIYRGNESGHNNSNPERSCLRLAGSLEAMMS